MVTESGASVEKTFYWILNLRPEELEPSAFRLYYPAESGLKGTLSCTVMGDSTVTVRTEQYEGPGELTCYHSSCCGIIPDL